MNMEMNVIDDIKFRVFLLFVSPFQLKRMIHLNTQHKMMDSIPNGNRNSLGIKEIVKAEKIRKEITMAIFSIIGGNNSWG